MTDEERKKVEEAFEIYYESFQNDFKYTSRHTKSFAQHMWEIIENEKATYIDARGKQISTLIRDKNHFAGATGLGPSTYDRIKYNRPGWVPSIQTFMTLCMIYQLNITMVRELRQSYGYDFNAKSKVHQAYVYLLVNCRGKSLFYCNKVLKRLGVAEKYYLGDGTIDEEWVNAEALRDT